MPMTIQDVQHIPALGTPPPVPSLSDEDVPPGVLQRRKTDSVDDKLINEEIENQKANRQLRDTYASKAYDLARICIAFWIVAVISNGLVSAIWGKQMFSDTVVIAVTTGVTINVLAAFLGVIKGLFPSENAKPADGGKAAGKVAAKAKQPAGEEAV